MEKSNYWMSKKLIPGDCVILNNGNIVPADIRLTETVSLMVNQLLYPILIQGLTIGPLVKKLYARNHQKKDFHG